MKVKLLELPDIGDLAANPARVQRQQAKWVECDVLGLDTIWTAEFGAKGWLKDISGELAEARGEFIPSSAGERQGQRQVLGGSRSTRTRASSITKTRRRSATDDLAAGVPVAKSRRASAIRAPVRWG